MILFIILQNNTIEINSYYITTVPIVGNNSGKFAYFSTVI